MRPAICLEWALYRRMLNSQSHLRFGAANESGGWRESEQRKLEIVRCVHLAFAEVQRSLFQVSASDSSTLIDSPIASRLGPQRVILHSEETGTQEKFRPYAWPSTDWIDRLFPRQ